jgi:site-specific recombinase XerD
METALVKIELETNDAPAPLAEGVLVEPGAGALELGERSPARVLVMSMGSGGSRVVVESALNIMAGMATAGRCNAETMPWAALRFQHTAAIRAALAQRYSHTTANRMLSALRGVLRAAWELGLMPDADYHRAASIKAVKGETLPAGRAATAGELRALFGALDDSPGATRDAALLAVLYGAGLRRAEVVELDLSDYDAETGALKVRHGKGNKARIVYATNGAKGALDAWIELRGNAPGALFLPVQCNGKIIARRMTTEAVLKLLRKRAAQAGIETLSPHDLRRTFISDLLDAGADIVTVQKLAGHSSVETTARYDRRGEATKLKASQMLHVPIAPKRAKAAK